MKRLLPILVVVLALLVVWYIGAVFLNAPFLIDTYARNHVDWNWQKLMLDAWSQERPSLPAPHQVLAEFWKTTFDTAVNSKRSLVYHAWVTLSATLLGFVIGTVLGVLLAVLIVHNDASDRSLMPWIIMSQAIPIVALAPVLVVVTVTLMINVLKIFDLVYIIAPSSSQQNANVLALQLYLSSFGGGDDQGVGSAIGVILLLLVLPVMIFNIRRLRREGRR